MRKSILAAAVLLLSAPAAFAQQAQELAQKTSPFAASVSTGVDYSSGDYGAAQNTNILVVPLSFRATTGDWAFTATLPYLNIDGPGGVVVGPDGQPVPGVPSIPGSRDGVGDISLGAAYTIRPAISGLEVALGGRVKLPTSADSKHLGTGKTDVKISADISYAVGDIVPFANLGYRFLGDPPAIDLHDGPTMSLGFSAPVGKAVLIASYDYARATTSFTDDSHELFGGLSYPLTDRFTVTGYGTAGLSRGAPDVGLGLLLTAKVF
jgi:hypothetical protein